MAYRPTFSIDSIGDPHPRAERLALAHMGSLLGALIDVDEEYLADPGVGPQIPLLYESGVRYDRLEPPPGSACGDDDWADVIAVNRLKLGDCEDIAAYRVAELRRRMNIEASAHLTLRTNGDRTRHSFHILVRWPDARLLDARIRRAEADLARLRAARRAVGNLRYPAYTFRGPDGEHLEDPSRLLGM